MYLDRIDHNLLAAMSVYSEANRGIRLDDDNTIFLKRQLLAVETRVYSKKYPDLAWSQMLPIQTDKGRGPKHFSYVFTDHTGTAKFMEPGAGNLPLVGLKHDEVIGQYRSFGDKFILTWDDIDAANFANIPLQTELAMAARHVWEILANDTSHFGNSALKLDGLLSDPSVLTAYSLPNGAAGTKTFITKTGQEVYQDIVNAIDLVSNTTENAFLGAMVMLPTAQFNCCSSINMSIYDSRSPMVAVQQNMEKRGRNIQFLCDPKLKAVTQGSISNKDVMIVHPNDEEVAAIKLPMRFTMFPMRENEDGNFAVPCWGRTGGVVLRHPAAIVYAAGI